MQQRECQLVDANVVVFPECARRQQWPRIAFVSEGFAGRLVLQVPVAVNLVGHAKAVAFPFAGLLQQLQPGDGPIVLSLKADARHFKEHRFIQIGQQPTVVGDACQQRQISLGHRKGQVWAVRFAPFDDLPAPHAHHARYAATRMHRAQQPVPRWPVGGMNAPVGAVVPVPWGFVGNGKVNSRL